MIKNAEFLTGISRLSQYEGYPVEIAVAGKSNVGKSSFINFICRRNKLAKTSKEPGRTRQINFFKINGGEFVLADLPGYGFAKVSRAEKSAWGELVEGYFQNSKGLKNVFLLLDIRHRPTENDVATINYLYCSGLPFTIIATKADKLSRAQGMRKKKEIADYVKVGTDDIFLCSAHAKTGADKIYERIAEIIGNEQ